MTEQPRTKTSERRREQFASSYSSFRKKWGILWRGMTPEERRATIEQLFVPPGETAQSYILRFTTLLSLSVVIAFCGLHANSTAVVIGAMLVAPLMEPILAMAGAMVMDWRQRLLRSVALVAWGAFLSVALAALLGTLVPDRIVVVPEVLARTNPTLLDLGVALGAGAAGAYTLVKRVSVAMPGVAVAVALVPPLTVIGITLEEARYDMAASATLLFATNLFAILLAAAVVLLIAGFTPARIRQRSRTWLRTSLSTTFVGVIAIAIPLTLYTSLVFRKELIRDAVIDSVEEWRGFLTQEILQIGLQEGQIVVNLASETPPPALAALANSIASQVGEDVEIKVRWVPLTEAEVAGAYRGKSKRLRRFRPRSFEPLY